MNLQERIENSEIRVQTNNDVLAGMEYGGVANAAGYEPTDPSPIRIIEDGNPGGLYHDGHRVSGIEKNGTGIMAFDDVMAGIYRDGHKFDNEGSSPERKTLMPGMAEKTSTPTYRC